MAWAHFDDAARDLDETQADCARLKAVADLERAKRGRVTRLALALRGALRRMTGRAAVCDAAMQSAQAARIKAESDAVALRAHLEAARRITTAGGVIPAYQFQAAAAYRYGAAA